LATTPYSTLAHQKFDVDKFLLSVQMVDEFALLVRKQTIHSHHRINVVNDMNINSAKSEKIGENCVLDKDYSWTAPRKVY
jgi:hypothetical protein